MKNLSQRERYSLRSSPFFRLSTQKNLAKLLGFSKANLERMATTSIKSPEKLYNFRSQEIGGKQREIECPVKEMRRLHERVKRLLNRVQLPEYLFSPRGNRSFLDNAKLHEGAEQMFKLDIRKFYPSTTDEIVYRFFLYDLQMVDDVAGLLTKLVTIRGHLPFGSPSSPILGFLACQRMFDGVTRLLSANDVVPSLYVDDITMSGSKIDKNLPGLVKKKIEKLGYKTHKQEFQTARRGFSITGVRLDERGLSPLNRSNIKIRNALTALKRARLSEEKVSLVDKLIGMNGHRLGVFNSDHPGRRRAEGLQQHLIERRKALSSPKP